MKKLLITLALTFLVSACASTSNVESSVDDEQDAQSWEAYCQSNDCRKDVRFKLRFDDGPVDQVLPYYSPVIQDDVVISILPGESLYVEADLTEQGLKNLKHVSTNRNSNKTIELSFRQIKDSKGMILQMNNPFDKALKFDMYMLALNDVEPHYTSSCPVLPGKSILEMWPHPIPELHIILREIYDQEKPQYTCD